jgi:hypothetical protein
MRVFVRTSEGVLHPERAPLNLGGETQRRRKAFLTPSIVHFHFEILSDSMKFPWSAIECLMSHENVANTTDSQLQAQNK